MSSNQSKEVNVKFKYHGKSKHKKFNICVLTLSSDIVTTRLRFYGIVRLNEVLFVVQICTTLLKPEAQYASRSVIIRAL